MAVAAAAALWLLLVGCASPDEPILAQVSDLSPVALQPGEGLRVVATTSIVADVVSEVGATEIELTRIIPIGVDPHGFQPTPQDLAEVSRSHVVFANGLGLEGPLLDTLAQSGGGAPIVSVSSDISPRRFGETEDGPGDEEHVDEGEADPHVWFDPTHVMSWVRTIQEALSRLSPGGADTYRRNAARYLAELEELDLWIRGQVDRIPPGSRLLVTDHDSLGYLADRYDFEIVGALTPGFSSEAEASAQDLVALQEKVSSLGIGAVFVGTTIDPAASARMAEDWDVLLLPLYTGSLSPPDGPAPSYLEMMRLNLETIVAGLGRA